MKLKGSITGSWCGALGSLRSLCSWYEHFHWGIPRGHFLFWVSLPQHAKPYVLGKLSLQQWFTQTRFSPSSAISNQEIIGICLLSLYVFFSLFNVRDLESFLM